MNTTIKATLAFVVLAGGMAIADPTAAQGYPTRPVRIIVPFAPGGGTDVMARQLAQKLNEAWAQPVVVENRTGAGGIIGADAAAKSTPDGYTFLMGTTTTAINASLVVKPPYNMQRDLQPVAMLSFYPMAAVMRADSPARSLKDLVALSHKQELSAASGGNGTPQHLVLEMFKGATGAKILHVPYKGGNPALAALLGGQNDVVFSLWPECLPHVQSGKLRPLAVTTPTRLAQIADVPTTAEAGFPSVQATGWQGVMVRAGTPKDIVARINAQVNSIMAAPEMKSRIVEQGFMPVTMGVGDTEKFVKGDVERWGKIIRDGNIKSE
ncbi:MAG TPA: tripartite tricarboxylate transporter substrate binding protein [Burkholderiales bacterium]|nr:tripartite tricarboxylate transporter substrate binding protein [Burkholderiales bacterium]